MLMRGEFIEYVKLVENGGKAGFDGETWFPHASPEGGNDTIAYGHKLKNDESWMKVGISDMDAENLLIADLQIAAEGASNVISEFGSSDFDALCQNCQEIFTDFVFNLGSGGLRKFPKFVTGTLDHDTEIMHQEYKRFYRNGYGELKELEYRNAEFAKMFF